MQFLTTTEKEESTVSVPMQHATYETLYQIGEKFEEFQKDKSKTLVVACTHSTNETNKVDITSKSMNNTNFIINFYLI